VSFDRRREVRVPWRCNVQLYIGEGEAIAATLSDVSRSGVAIDVEQWIDAGTEVRVMATDSRSKGLSAIATSAPAVTRSAFFVPGAFSGSA